MTDLAIGKPDCILCTSPVTMFPGKNDVLLCCDNSANGDEYECPHATGKFTEREWRVANSNPCANWPFPFGSAVCYKHTGEVYGSGIVCGYDGPLILVKELKEMNGPITYLGLFQGSLCLQSEWEAQQAKKQEQSEKTEQKEKPNRKLSCFECGCTLGTRQCVPCIGWEDLKKRFKTMYDVFDEDGEETDTLPMSPPFSDAEIKLLREAETVSPEYVAITLERFNETAAELSRIRTQMASIKEALPLSVQTRII